MGERRASWRTLNDKLSDLEYSDNDKYKKYLNMVENELLQIANSLLNLLQNYILKTISYNHDDYVYHEDKVFYYKMAGDYNRYLCEIFPLNEEYINKAEYYYGSAIKIAEKYLTATHPTLLGLKLNFAVYLYEIATNKSKACLMAKTAFDNAINKLDTLGDSSYKDSTLIMRLLRDNLTLWTSE